jgi:hypothetical protein
VCILLGVSTGFSKSTTEFEPRGYQVGGALVLNQGGDAVEPYMATKALLIAQDAGLDVRRAALAWIGWILPRQLPDGRFQQYCRKPGAEWRSCGPADADDAMLALWLQLLYRLAPNTGIPPEWRASVDRAEAHLAKLRNRRWGVYRISRHNHVGLFMDNVEVYAALRDVARAQRRFGNLAAAEETERRAGALAEAIQHIFWDQRARIYFASTQRAAHWGFYPEAVAQTYPWLNDMPTPEDPRTAWRAWVGAYGSDWLNRRSVREPWGLLALTALHLEDESSAACWLERASAQRDGGHWHLLEEAAFQGVQAELRQRAAGRAAVPPPVTAACSKLKVAR